MATVKSNTESWNEFASECPDEPMLHLNGLKDAVYELFIPYNVSCVKFMINFQYLMNLGDDPFLNHLICIYTQIITPSCVLWDDSLNRPMGYETWFFAAFPDVADWAAEKTNQRHIEKFFQNTSSGELEEDYGGITRLRTSVLKKIIQTYIDVTHKQLETTYSREEDARIMTKLSNLSNL